ncbi:protein FRG1 homolog [Leguminivora glycinivorella]|uniref:protein FRG1 homolog n=1 Tax=Leguminivora glycinivorella TaxID=1035111 RepID=UPI0020105472|nr:protein FRG1 homolog [Leguminivora glycinivorella]
MADEYAAVKRGKLILKGDKPKAKKRKHKKNKDKSDSSKVDEDSIKHGGWWKVEKIEDVVGSISIEFGNNAYISALDNGLFTVGAPHGDGEGPAPEEIFTAFPAGETKFALKSGYGKYLGVSKEGVVIGRSDAVGPMEQWEPVWQESKTAILSALNKFMCVSPEDDSVVAWNAAAGETEFCSIRSNKAKEVNTVVLPDEEQGNLNEVEVNYVRKFQKFQDKKLKLNDGSVSELKRAKAEGTLHETLLDRRSKMKADRYCK